MRAAIERIARGGPDAVASAIASLKAFEARLAAERLAAEAPEPTTRAGWARKEIAELAAQGKTAVRTRHSFGVYGTGPCDVVGALVKATDKTMTYVSTTTAMTCRASLTSRKATVHTAPCQFCPDSEDGPFNEANEKDHCSIHGSRLRDFGPEYGRGCESCRSS